ncbi:hypothetical protein Alches_15480 [Alicyclobacillus hesperidum subsp. aegles]|uniref:DUF1540 domain-containing protein n=1 Tax=Alicyclobacillus hesperidum TaxID=89784 RepID=UPI000AC3543F|nr:DUF1540 domain-containing protein [Alicyclobacillus hesperidum]GLG01509.1 hypothetical protein Alches_15480 [Alicyclobacillus hesperidum subsp. aegles]
MMVDVKCSVSNCYFWKANNDCAAPGIMVTVDNQSRANFREEIASEIAVDTKRTDWAQSSMQTCCHTFRPKSQNNASK